MKEIDKELSKALQDPKNAEIIYNEVIKFALRMSGKVFKTMFEHKEFLPLYAKFLYRMYQEFLEAGFTDEQAFELVKIVATTMPIINRW
jgi:hypothetical protein